MLDLLCLFYALRQRLQAVHANDRDGDAGTLMERRAARPISVAQTPDSQAAYFQIVEPQLCLKGEQV